MVRIWWTPGHGGRAVVTMAWPGDSRTSLLSLGIPTIMSPAVAAVTAAVPIGSGCGHVYIIIVPTTVNIIRPDNNNCCYNGIFIERIYIYILI